MKKYIEIDLNLLAPSPTNPRKSFDDLKDLAASIKVQGVLEPLIVRAVGESFEIIAGERRFRAAKLNGLDKVPCVVHDLKDEEVLEIQIIENMQRTDLSPMEEAEGYNTLHNEKGISYDDLAARIGKSKNYIYTRLRLLSLIPEARKALLAGTMPLSYAEQLTRVIDPKVQKKALEAKYYSDTLEEFKREIENFLLVIKNAPFKTNTITESCKLGPCNVCEKRTGSDKDLFGDAGKMDTCLDPECWNKRKEAYKKEQIALYEEKGMKILTPKESERFRYNKTLANSTDENLKSGTTWKTALKGKESEILVVEDENGKFVEIVDPSKAIKQVPKELIKKVATDNKSVHDVSREKHEKAEAIKERTDILLADAIAKKMNKSGVNTKIFRMALNIIFQSAGYEIRDLVKSIYKDTIKDHEKGIFSLEKIKDNELPGVLAFMLLGQIKKEFRWDDKAFKKKITELSALYCIDMAEIKEKAILSLKVVKKEDKETKEVA